MYKDVRGRRDRGERFDFILATGDLAFSGKPEEYDRAGVMLDNLAAATCVDRQNIFCIPGNHDVNRGTQKTCFVGATQLLTTQNDVDQFVDDKEEIESLLKRLDSSFKPDTWKLKAGVGQQEILATAL